MLNESLEVYVSNLAIDKDKFQKDVMHLKFLFSKNKNKLKKITTESRITHKSVKMMNTGTKQLNHILTLGNSSADHHILGYQERYNSSVDILLKLFDQ